MCGSNRANGSYGKGEPACFYVIFRRATAISRRCSRKVQTEFAEFDSNEGDFLGEVPLLLGTPFFASLRALSSCRIARLDKQQFFHLIRDSEEARDMILRQMGKRLLLDPGTHPFLRDIAGVHLWAQ